MAPLNTRAPAVTSKVRRLLATILVLFCVMLIGTGGYWLLGFTPLDAAYQTVTTITTVGFREVKPLSPAGQVFTMVLIVIGVGSALYTFSVTFEMLLEGELNQARRRRRMVRQIEGLRDHVLICGWGRVGKAIANHMKAQGETVVVIDNDPVRLEGIEHLYVTGDATDDHVLVEAGVDRAKALIAAINTDAANLYITLSGRSLRPDLFIIARARDASSDAKLQRAGADRVVNPQAIGGARMAAFVSQPHVAEFLDVVMHEGQVEFRLGEVTVTARSPLAGLNLADAGIRERTGALILAVRNAGGEFLSNPPVNTRIEPGQVLIAIGTPSELDGLTALNAG
jgi:voltage-gated potassium channel